MSPALRWMLPLAALSIVVPAARAQVNAASSCASAEHRQFDFWIGTWNVTDSSGQVLGTNEITRIAGGCGLREHWRGAQGGEGMSLNAWRGDLGVWTQFWVGVGTVLHLTGGLDAEGRIVLGGDRSTPQGTVRDRVTWEPLPAGAVRQMWDVSSDEGATWRRIFDGIYRRAGLPD